MSLREPTLFTLAALRDGPLHGYAIAARAKSCSSGRVGPDGRHALRGTRPARRQRPHRGRPRGGRRGPQAPVSPPDRRRRRCGRRGTRAPAVDARRRSIGCGGRPHEPRGPATWPAGRRHERCRPQRRASLRFRGRHLVSPRSSRPRRGRAGHGAGPDRRRRLDPPRSPRHRPHRPRPARPRARPRPARWRRGSGPAGCSRPRLRAARRRARQRGAGSARRKVAAPCSSSPDWSSAVSSAWPSRSPPPMLPGCCCSRARRRRPGRRDARRAAGLASSRSSRAR